ncbi:extensin family protein [Roseovarius sp. LXJ103]|uniref:extensin-like domain-containing protein n=1 Tax=Roseovarius carneus TaxID=2853164 RepID=UPI000D61F415|nr:extensin family protein [Roseovarius carneus]MBZ8118095.1 extensin family protein [Roseovarius carneus]PWE36164.1 extensin-like protein [Pelagicola sp. LXJ1103]
MKRILPIVLSMSAGWAAAQAPDTSLRPVARSGSEQTGVASVPDVQAQPETALEQTGADNAQIRQVNSRVGERPVASASAPAREDGVERRGLFSSLRPLLRPRAVGEKGVAAQNLKARGAVCGDLAIQGEVVGAVPGKIKGCGVINAVKVREVSGISLSQHAVMDCVTAKALKSWVNNGVKPAVGNTGGGVKGLQVAAHYVCRTRNHKPGAKISEHGKGRAIDIAAIQLHDGSELSVSRHWRTAQRGRMLKQMHKAACGPFGTVLGPDGDRYHQNHFHLDTARHRGGPFCR